jgi:hypothetical protein
VRKHEVTHVPGWALSAPEPKAAARVRLRPLTEAECYARCYGARDERVSVLHDLTESTRPLLVAESRLRELVERRLTELSDETGREAA